MPLVIGASILLSMGLPSTVLYIVVATVVAPALIELGVLPLAAHLFVFWFGALSNVTPPVAIASYTAAGIARADPAKTAWTGLRLTLAGFIIPFMFVYSTSLILQHPHALEIIIALITSVVGIFALGIATQNYLTDRTSIYERVLFFISSILLIKPDILTDAWVLLYLPQLT